MIRPILALCLLGSLCGCGGGSARPGPQRQAAGQWTKAFVSYVRVQSEALGDLANSGAQLPVVSPDGQWVAYLRLRGDRPIEREAIFTGTGLEAMSLHVREVTLGSQPRQICRSRAAWPAWSADGRTLVFVAYKNSGGCDLATYDVVTGRLRRTSVGHKRIIMPAVSPMGDRVAFVAPAAGPGQARLHVITLDSGKQESCPAGPPATGQYCPQWTADGRIVYVTGRDGRAWLSQWAPGKFPPEDLCEINVTASDAGVYQSFAGLGQPLSPDGRRFAYYDIDADRIVLMDLRDGKRTRLSVGTRAGCWLDPARFIAAKDKEMLLFAGGPQAVVLMRGRWLPRGHTDQDDQLILCTPGRHGREFALVRMTLIKAR